MTFPIIIGLIAAFGVICGIIDYLAPGAIYALLDGFFGRFRIAEITPCENPDCMDGLIPDGLNGEGIEKYKICPVCDKTGGATESKINDYVEIIEDLKSKRATYVPHKQDNTTISKTWSNNGRALRPTKKAS